MNARTGRNDPCPCGSGKKFKHCCLGKEQGPAAASKARDLYQEGSRAFRAGHFEAAVMSFRRALSLQPDHFEALVDMGNALNQLRRHREALPCFERALELRPHVIPLLMNIGAALDESGEHEQAIAWYERALKLDPAYPALYHNLATAFRRAKRLEEAVAAFRQCLTLGEAASLTHHALVGSLLDLRRYGEALEAVDRAIEAHPADADLLSSRGSILLTMGRVWDAIDAYDKADEVDKERSQPPKNPLAWLYPDDFPRERMDRELDAISREFEAPLAASRAFLNRPDPERKLRVGYVSGDFRAHSVAYFIEPILAHHDRERFSVHCYYTAAAEDEFTRRLRSCADAWVPSDKLDEGQLARRVRDDGIDILVDLAGYTTGGKLLAFARRPAPVQLSWLGYPDRTGFRAIDAMISDPVASPPGSGGVDDRLARLPRVFSCYRPHPQAPGTGRLGEDGALRLCSFNNIAKISETTVRLWSRVLAALPEARLVIKDKGAADEIVRDLMLARFARHGIEPGRLEFLSRAATEAEHLELYRRMDVALDTYPYCGVTTTCEALWMGVPVVSLAGEAFRSRMGATLLSNVGHADWAASDEDAYVRKAVDLARDTALRRELRGGLREQMRASPLMDEAGLTRELESLYRERWSAWCRSGGT